MDILFLNFLNRSIAAGWLILAVILMRLVLKKAPRNISCILWALVGIRLLCPFSFESVLSLIPSAETVPENIMYEQRPVIESGIDMINRAVNPVLSDSFAPVVGTSVNPLQIILFLVAVLWLAGIGVMLLYAGVSYFRLCIRVRTAMRLEENLWMCDEVDSPFILGILAPRIYLPSNLSYLPSSLSSGQSRERLAFVIAHERAHLKRHDHWWKPLGFLLLSVYWFQPLCWAAYILFCRDIELACDERVVREMGNECKKNYAEALLSCSVPHSGIAACPLAFGEVGIKARIKVVLNYKRSSFWIALAAAAVCIAAALCFLTNPLAEPESIFGARYLAKNLLYDAPEYDSLFMPDILPEYVITSDALLMERGSAGDGTWNAVGGFHEAKYSKKEIASFFELPNGIEADQSEELAIVRENLDKVEMVWRVDAEDNTFWLVMLTEGNRLLMAKGYDTGSRLRVRWLWEMEKQSGHYDSEYLATQIASMCGKEVQIYATYESDTIPQNILVGFIVNNSGTKKGLAVFRYDVKTDSYKIRGYETFERDALSCVTIAQDWGFDHSVTIVLSGRSDLAYVTVESGEEVYRENTWQTASPAMLVFEWEGILSDEQAAAMEVHYYNDRDQELR